MEVDEEEMKMEIVELTIYIDHYNETIVFYKEVIGLSVKNETERQITFHVGTSLLTLHQADEDASNYYHFAFNIPPNLFLSAKTWLSERVKLAKEEQDDEINFAEAKAKAVYFEDPAGNIVELIARQTSAIANASSFQVTHLINISEIGIATNNVIKLANQLLDKGIPVRNNESIHREKYLNFFGEYKDGVYIITAPVGRRWIFSEKAALEAPMIIRTNKGTIE